MKRAGGFVVAALLLALAVWLAVRRPAGGAASSDGGASAADGGAAARASDPTARGGIDIEAAANVMVAVHSDVLRRVVTTNEQGKAALRDLPAGRYHVGPVTADVRANEITVVKLPVAGAPTGALTLAGTVHDLTGGTVPGAEVWIDWNVVRTDGTGKFYARVNAGTYELRLRAPGYAEAVEELDVQSDLTIDLVMHPSSTLEGSVVHADGTPAAGARVTVEAPLAEGSSVFAGEDGTFRIEGLPAGKFDVRAATATEVGGVEDVNVPPASARSVRIVLAPAATLSGTVRGPDGKPVADAKVKLLDEAATAGESETTTASDGTYRFLAILPGVLALEGCAPGFGCTESRQFFVGKEPVSIDLKLEAEGALRFHVVNEDGQAVAGAVAKSIDEETTCTSDATGDCTMRGLRPRALSFEIAHPTAGFELVEVVVRRGETKREVKLRAGVTIRGTVRWEDGSAAAGVHVTVRGGRVTRTEPDGRFELKSVPTYGSIVVAATTAIAMSGRELDQWLEDFDSPRSKRIKAKAGETVEDVELKLQHQDQSLHGTVVGSDGAPVAYAAVGCVRESKLTELITDHASLEAEPRTYAGADGAFTVEGLDAGSYIVWAHDEAGGRGSVKGAVAGKSDVTIKLGLPAGLEGTVTDERGKPVPFFIVRMEAADTRRFTDGRFSWKGVRPGHHDLQVIAGDATAQDTVEIVDGKTTTRAFVLKTGITVTGRIVAWPEMNPVEGIVVSVSDPFHHHGDPTGPDGRFSIANVLPARIDLIAESPGGSLGAGFGDVWPRNLEAKPSPTDIGDLALVPAPDDEDAGHEPGESLDDEVVRVGDDAPARATGIVSVDGHPIEMFGIMGKSRVLAKAKPDSIVRKEAPR